MGVFSFLFKKKGKSETDKADSGSNESSSDSGSAEMPKLSEHKQGILHKWFIPPDKIDLFMEIDKDLKEDLQAFKTVVLNYKKKVDLIHIFIENWSDKDLKKLRKQMDLIKMMVEIDESKEKSEERYTLKALKTIEKIITSEERYSLKNLEEEVKMNLNILKLDIEKLKPILVEQLEFFYQTDDQIKKQVEKITILLRSVKDEAVLLGIEHGEIKTLQDDMNKLESMLKEQGGEEDGVDKED